MRRREALQGVRMIKFLDILGRYEALEFNQLEAAELLGVGERTFRRWCQRYEDDGEVGLLGPAARQGVRQAGSGLPGGRGGSALPHALRRFHGEAFSRAFGEGSSFQLELHLDQDLPAVEGAFGEGPAPWCASAQASAPALARHAAASGRVAASMACGAADA